jgi:ATP-dependent Clp protease ATP-binding subunit ClpB
VEEKALSKEKDPLSQQRLKEVQKELAALEDMLKPLQLRYQQEKARLDAIRKLQAKREELLVQLQLAEQRHDMARMADIKYGALPVSGGQWGMAGVVCGVVWRSSVRACGAVVREHVAQ